MSSRNMIASNTAVFSSIDKYCVNCEEPLSTAGQPRWISTTSSERRLLMDATLVAELSLSTSLKLARYDLSGRSYFVSSGFDLKEVPDPIQASGLDAGLLTAFLSELIPTPSAIASRVRDVVDVADKTSTPGYAGHDPSLISGLYPNILMFTIDDLLIEESFKIFFLICLYDRRCLQQWIDVDLGGILSLITELNPLFVPYEILCSSVLEMDPAALFLAFYRCLEALYAHTQTHRLMTQLGVSKQWTEMARTLEETLGWYPREEPSLEALLKHAVIDDLQSVASSLDDEIPSDARPAAYVAKRIYQLRNALVHYRPFQQKFSFKGTNWNRLCEAMALLVLHIYGEVSRVW
jgi:hypothetical protein